MPADLNELSRALASMKRSFIEDPDASIRSQVFIHILHSYCVYEMRRAGFPEENIKEEQTIFGSHKTKDVDVAYIDPINGPLVIIGLRSQMSSVGNNVLTYYEEIIGDCISLHDRYPMAVIGYIYMLPRRSIKLGKEKDVDLERYETLYKLITNRGDWRNPKDKYEHFAFLKVDFHSNPPQLLDTLPEIQITDFFDKLKATYNERNYFAQI